MNNYLFSRFVFCFCTLVSIGAWAQAEDSILFVTSDQVETYWVSVKEVAPIYPVKLLRKGEQGCVAVGYIIEPDGTTSNHRVVASYPSESFYRPSIKAAKQFLYEPTVVNKDREAIFTTKNFTFQISKNKKYDKKLRAQLGALCTAAANKALNADTGKAGAG